MADAAAGKSSTSVPKLPAPGSYFSTTDTSGVWCCVSNNGFKYKVKEGWTWLCKHGHGDK